MKSFSFEAASVVLLFYFRKHSQSFARHEVLIFNITAATTELLVF